MRDERDLTPVGNDPLHGVSSQPINQIKAFLLGSFFGLVISLFAAFLLIFGLDYLVAYYFGGIAEDDAKHLLGLPPLAARAVYFGAVLTMVGLWWWLVKRKRSWDTYVLACSAAIPFLYYGFLFQATHNYDFDRAGRPLKCYVVTHAGVRMLPLVDQKLKAPQFDTESGQECKPMSKEVRPRIVKLDKLLKSGGKIAPVIPTELEFFSGFTNEPLLWYAKEDEEIRFYDVPGFDPGTGTELKPVDLKVRSEWKTARAINKPLETKKVGAMPPEIEKPDVTLSARVTKSVVLDVPVCEAEFPAQLKGVIVKVWAHVRAGQLCKLPRDVTLNANRILTAHPPESTSFYFALCDDPGPYHMVTPQTADWPAINHMIATQECIKVSVAGGQVSVGVRQSPAP